MRRALCVLLGLVWTLAAQTDRATLTGTVVDPSQTRIQNAQVVLKSSATGVERETTTNATGSYSFTSLPVGQYTASITAPGFQTLQFEPFLLQVGETRTLNAELNIASVGQSVQVKRPSAQRNHQPRCHSPSGSEQRASAARSGNRDTLRPRA